MSWCCLWTERRKLSSFARETQTRERRGLRVVPCGARGLADPGCCAAVAAAAAAAKAGGGLEWWWWRRRQRQRPGSSHGSPNQLAAEVGERPTLPGACRTWLAPGNNMGKNASPRRGPGGGVECRRPRRARPRLWLLFRCHWSRRWPRTPGLGGKGSGGDGVREVPGGSSGARGVCHTVVTRVPATALVGRSLHSWIPGGERPEASRLARPSREKAVERLSWRLAQVWERAQPPSHAPAIHGVLGPGGAPRSAVCSAVLAQQPAMLRTPSRPEPRRNLIPPPPFAGEARDLQVSVWVVP